ncbi:hypothetical protein VUR80DRAFT_6812 [Thermomyces stellatus]
MADVGRLRAMAASDGKIRVRQCVDGAIRRMARDGRRVRESGKRARWRPRPRDQIKCGVGERPRYVLTRLARYCGVKIHCVSKAAVELHLHAEVGFKLVRRGRWGQRPDPIHTYYTVYRYRVPITDPPAARPHQRPLQEKKIPPPLPLRACPLHFVRHGGQEISIKLVVGRHVPPSPSPCPLLFSSFFPCFGYSHGWAPPLTTAYITSALSPLAPFVLLALIYHLSLSLFSHHSWFPIQAQIPTSGLAPKRILISPDPL